MTFLQMESPANNNYDQITNFLLMNHQDPDISISAFPLYPLVHEAQNFVTYYGTSDNILSYHNISHRKKSLADCEAMQICVYFKTLNNHNLMTKYIIFIQCIHLYYNGYTMSVPMDDVDRFGPDDICRCRDGVKIYRQRLGLNDKPIKNNFFLIDSKSSTLHGPSHDNFYFPLKETHNHAITIMCHKNTTLFKNLQKSWILIKDSV